jgi:membrane protease YdiL (CAAX protease family)
VNGRRLLAYFVLAYAISWSIAIPLALGAQGVISPVLPEWAHYFMGYGPMLAALIVTRITEGAPGLRRLGSSIVQWRVRPVWWIVAVSPLVFGFITAVILNLAAGSAIGLSDLGVVHFLPPLGLGALVLWIVTFGIGEEIGWRGYALPRLQKGRSALTATSILFVLWALWHLPAFF